MECKLKGGELQLGGISRSVKALDLLRDLRFALHGGSDDPPDWPGDAKIAGVARAGVGENADHGRHHLFAADIHEAVLIGLDDAPSGADLFQRQRGPVESATSSLVGWCGVDGTFSTPPGSGSPSANGEDRE